MVHVFPNGNRTMKPESPTPSGVGRVDNRRPGRSAGFLAGLATRHGSEYHGPTHTPLGYPTHRWSTAGLSNAATVVLSIALAFVFGYALTVRGVLRAGLPFREAARVALAADTVSIVVMEIVDNAVVLLVPGAMAAGIGSALFWASLAGSLAVAFVVTVPVNRALISRGKGHAVVHALH